MKTKRSTNRIVALLLCGTLALGILPGASVFAETAEDNTIEITVTQSTTEQDEAAQDETAQDEAGQGVQLFGAPVMPLALGDVYLNGASGSDANSGDTAATAVKTMEKALELVAGAGSGGDIFVCGQVTVSVNAAWNAPGVTVKRNAGYTGILFNITGTGTALNVTGITFDGQSIAANAQIFNVGATNGVLTVTDCAFKNLQGGTALGGAILGVNKQNTTITVKNIAFADCKARYGGAIVSYGDLTVEDSTFTNCSSANDGGAIWCESPGSLAVKRSAFTRCQANRNGGAIFANSGLTAFSVEGGSFTGCSASNGGAIYASKAGQSFSDFTVSNCTAAASGGGMYVVNSATMRNVTVSGCSAPNNGGGIIAAGGAASATLTMLNCTVENCEASGNQGRGGGMHSLGVTLSATNTTFQNNKATSYGGGVYGGAGSYTDCFITGNESVTTQGGGLHTNAQDVTLTGCTVSDNTAATGGGGIATNGQGPLTIVGSTISGNRVTSAAAEGGGILLTTYAGRTPVIHIRDTSITGNVCGSNALGGGIGSPLARGEIYVSGEVIVSGNKTALGIEANVGNHNTPSALASYEVFVEGALTGASSIGISTAYNVDDLLCVKGANGYSLTASSDLDYFTHDRITRGEADALKIIWKAADSTYVLGGHSYLVEHWVGEAGAAHSTFTELTERTEEFVGLTGDTPPAANVAPQSIYGYTYAETVYENDAAGKIPTNNSMVVRLYYVKNDYNVTFTTEDANRGTVAGDTAQTVLYGNSPAGVVTTTPRDGDWFFTGWAYVMDGPDGSGTVSGTVYDYHDLTITGNATLKATFAKQPFVSISTQGGGSVSITEGTAADATPNGQTLDRYVWELGTAATYTGIGAFRADEHYHVKSIMVVRPAYGEFAHLNLASTAPQAVGTGGVTATLTLNADGTYGTVQLEGVQKAASVVVTFEEDAKHDVVFLMNDGTTAVYSTKTNIYEGEQLGAQPAGVPVRDGYNFLGWTSDPNANADAGDRADYDSGRRMGASDLTYYALWQPINNRTITYAVQIWKEKTDSADSASVANYALSLVNTVAIYTVGGTVSETPPTYVGYAYQAALSTNSGTAVAEPSLILNLYYAREHYQLHYLETDGTQLFAPQTFLYGAPVSAATPTKLGFVFEGWYTDTDCTKPFADGMPMPENDVDLYAKWVPVSYTVRYDGNGATSSAIMDENGVQWNQSRLIPTMQPLRIGYTFAGWSCGGTKVDASMTYAQLAALSGGDRGTLVVTLSAMWTKNPDPTPAPPTSTSPSASADSPKTGDSSPALLYAGMLVSSLAGLAYLLLVLKRKGRERG